MKDNNSVWRNMFNLAESKMLNRGTKTGVLVEVVQTQSLSTEANLILFQEMLEEAVRLCNSKCGNKTIVISTMNFKHQDSILKYAIQYLSKYGIKDVRLNGTNSNNTLCVECQNIVNLYYKLDYKEIHCICSGKSMLRRMFQYIKSEAIVHFHLLKHEENIHNYQMNVVRRIPLTTKYITLN